MSAEDPFIYHYTFGVEYSMDGIPTVGAVGEWSLDKRHYFGGAPPKNLDRPPECALECAWVWWRMFNEATEAIGDAWPKHTGGNLRSFARNRLDAAAEASPFSRALTERGPWSFEPKGKSKEVLFLSRGRVASPWGGGSWSIASEAARQVTLSLCGSTVTLTFDSAEAPTTFTWSASRVSARVRDAITGGAREGALDARFADGRARSSKWRDGDAAQLGVSRLMGKGPWAWSVRPPSAPHVPHSASPRARARGRARTHTPH